MNFENTALTILIIWLSILSFYIACWIHELGHALGAVAMKIPLFSISLGNGRTIFQANLHGVACKINAFPGGNIRHSLSVSEFYGIALHKRIIYTSSGVMINTLAIIIFFLIVAKLYHVSPVLFVKNIFQPFPFGLLTLLLRAIHTSQTFHISVPISVFFLSNSLIVVTSLLPFIKSDGGNIIFCFLDKYYKKTLLFFIKFSTGVKYFISICILLAIIFDLLEIYRMVWHR
jgi:hypothetical protein